MNDIFFSIIIPFFNAEKYIEQCAKSALNQSFKGNFEVLAVNNGSDDSSEEILEKINDERLKIFNVKNLQGAAGARNFALDKAGGEYILFLDSDDYLDENALNNFYKIVQNKEADVVLAPYYVIYEKSGKKKLYYPLNKNLEFEGKNIETLKEKIFDTNFEVCTKLYKKNFLKEEGISFLPFKIAEDLPFYYEVLLKAEKISCIKNPVYFYRKGHKKPLIDGGIDYVEEVLGAIKAADKIVKENVCYEKFRKYYEKKLMLVILFWLKNFKRLKKRREFFRRSKLFLKGGHWFLEFLLRAFLLNFKF